MTDPSPVKALIVFGEGGQRRHPADEWQIDESGGLKLYKTGIHIATYAKGGWFSVEKVFDHISGVVQTADPVMATL